MDLANFINARPGLPSGKPKDDFLCACGQSFLSNKLRNKHTNECSLLNSVSSTMKRKAEYGYHSGAHVPHLTSQSRFRNKIRLLNSLRNDRAVTRRDALHTEPTILEKASENVAKQNINDDVDFDVNDDFNDEIVDDIASIASEDDIDPMPDDESESESEEEEEWEDVDEPISSDEEIMERLRNIKLRHSRRWAKYRNGDGYVRGGNKKPYEYKGNLPPYYIAQVSLLKILSQHRGQDLKLFDRIMHWVGFFSDNYPLIWSQRMAHRHHTRKGTLQYLANFFGTNRLIPKKKTAVMTDGSKIDVPVYDFQAVFENMMTDTDLINEDNLIQSNFDKETWRPIKKYSELSPYDTIDDLTTGSMYEKGIELYCNEDPPPGIHRILPAPIIIFTDEAHHDKKNGNKTGPVSICPAMVKQEVRAKDASWYNIAYIPNYGLGRGKYYGNYDDKWEVEDGKKKGKKTLTQEKVKEMKVKDRQILYETALSSFREWCDEYGGLRMMWRGKLCLVKPFILMVIGDSKEYNMITNHYNSNNARCLNKTCLCPWQDIGTKFPPECVRLTSAHREKASEDAEYAKFISYHQEASVWDDLPLADIIEGIPGHCPIEWLHLNGQGNYKDGVDVIHDVIGENQTKKSKKEELDMLFQAITNDIRRNSERNIPLIASRFAIMDLSNVTANERVGNYFVLILCLASKRGRQIMHNSFKEKGICINDVIDTMTSLLAYDAWCRSFGIPKWELDNARPAVAELMENMTIHLPKTVEEGSHGYHKLKFHGLWLMLDSMEKYASARNTSGEHGERLHKIIVGMNGDVTQQRPATFTVQCGTRDGERNIINHAFKHIRHECPIELTYNIEDEEDTFDETPTSDASAYVWVGQYSATCSAYSGRTHDVRYDVTWKRNEKTAAGVELHLHFLHCLTSWSVKQEYKEPFRITGYTEMRVRSCNGGQTIYRASDYYYGTDWYDWAFVEDPIVPSITYIGKILGFFRYDTPGYPTYKLVKIDKHDPDYIRENNLTDHTMYAVVIGSTQEYSLKALESKIVTPFRLECGDQAYIVPIRCIKSPLLVTRNFGSTTQTGYLHCLPQQKWPSLFTRRIIRIMKTNNVKV